MKHADLIRAALDGKKIQCRQMTGNGWGYYPTEWRTFADTRLAVADMAAGYTAFEYRLEPEPKPDVVRYGKACNVEYKANSWAAGGNNTYWTRTKSGSDNIKATFDGETGKLKSVEIV
jgi:hypothetical protein